MSDEARAIVREALRDRRVYDAMARREAEVWGRILPAREQSEARPRDRTAAAELRVRRGSSRLVAVARKLGLRFEYGLSVGCGEGRFERHLIESRICRRFHGVDISEDALQLARESAAAEDLDVTYESGDLNFMDFGVNAYDLVVAQTSLHHVVYLEDVADRIHGALKPGGYLWIHDFIGESQFQWDDKRLAIANRVLRVLPEKFRTNRIFPRVTEEIRRPEPGKLVSPFESIRSAEIPAIFQARFRTVWSRECDSIVKLIVPVGTRESFVENEDTRALFEVIAILDEILLEERILTPLAGQYLLRRVDD